MSKPSILTRIRHAIFGKPLTADQERTLRNAQLGRSTDNGQSHVRNVQSQNYWI